MLAANRQAGKRAASKGNAATDSDTASEANRDNVGIYPLAIPLLAGPSAIMSIIVVTSDFPSSLGSMVKGYAALIGVMITTGMILCAAVVAETSIDERISMVFSRITAITLVGLSVQYVIDGLASIGFVSL